jgi:hypothetical protein
MSRMKCYFLVSSYEFRISFVPIVYNCLGLTPRFDNKLSPLLLSDSFLFSV